MEALLEFLRNWGPLGVLLIAALDSAGVPLPAGVDALLVTVAVVNPGQAWLAAAVAVLGSLAGNLLLFYLARKGGEAYLRRHTQSPRAQHFRTWFRHFGLITVFIPAIVPIIPLPLKVFVLTAGATGVSWRAFIGTIVAGRVPRFFALTWLGLTLRGNTMQWLGDHAWHLSAVACLLFLALFVMVKLSDRLGRSPSLGAPL